MAPDMNMRWQDQKVVRDKDGRWVVEGRPGTDVSLAFQQTPSNIPGKTVIGLLVTYPPNGATPPHYHGGAAVFGTMIRGQSCMQMVHPGTDPEGQGTGPKIYGPGDSWYEPPGCHHVRSGNASETEDCQFQATFVIDTQKIEELGVMGALVQIDAEQEEKKAKAKV